MPKTQITGQQPFTLSMTDDALITFGAPIAPDAVTFTDTGYFPVNTTTIGGIAGDLKGKIDNLFVRYTGHGIQHFGATGASTAADYTDLHYELVGYKGDAAFGFAANGTPTVSDLKHETILAQGDLINGHLAFTATGGIIGQVQATAQIDGQSAGTLSISIQHAATDIGPAAGGFTLTGGVLQATFLPGTAA